MPSKPLVPLRKQLYIDHHVQGSLLRRIALYSFACVVYFVVILVFTEAMTDPGEPISNALYRCIDEAIYWAPGLVLLAPVIAYDMLCVTNRFAGPIFRLRREMVRLVDGKSEHPLNFREDDYWCEMADIFNKIRDEIQELRRAQDGTLRDSSDADTMPASPIVSQRQLFASEEIDPHEGDAENRQLQLNEID